MTDKAKEGPKSTEELTAFVDDLLSQMQTKFEHMSESIVGKIDDMNARIDDLERSLDSLIHQAMHVGQDTKESK